ncbi:MAG: DUF2188 domain-containing protein [Tissierella sp.]|uniref:DUF2188 domain-containing protein n=1 Tax=Tissierella sp. TaxID=41274 RepID=UPI003F99FCAA
MPWSRDDYPNSMKNLEDSTRNKAIEIANALLEDDYNESRAIAIAISQAKEWASKRSIIKTDGNDQHVVPHNEKWGILREGNQRVSHIYKTKEKALEKAKELAKNENVKVVVHRKDGTIQENLIP